MLKNLLSRYLAPPLLFLLISLIAATLRRTEEGEEYHTGLVTSGQPHIIASWHDMLFYLPWYYRSDAQKYRPLASPSRDGEVVARTIAFFGYRIVRGSSFKNAKRSLREMGRLAEKGESFGIVADGSRGPRHEIQKGAVMVAKLAEMPILPVAIGFSSCWRTKSWDHFMIPKPFARVVVVHAEPINVAAAGGRAAAQKLFGERLHAITARAESYFDD